MVPCLTSQTKNYLSPSFQHILSDRMVFYSAKRMLLSTCLVSLAMIASLSNSKAQVAGCTDPLANNYQPGATVNNGSCTYSPLTYRPVVKVNPMDDVLAETSALEMAGNFLWTLNDGGGAAAIYRIDTVTSAVLQTVYLAGTTNKDWEAMAFDGTSFYIGDIGNNVNGARTDLVIYKFPFSAIPNYITNPAATIPANLIEHIRYVYAEQPQPPIPINANSTRFDCEAILVANEKIHLFSKNWIDNNTTHYIINGNTAGNYQALPLETLSNNFMVTGAAKAPGQQMVALLGYSNTFPFNHSLQLLSDFKGDFYFNGNKRQLALSNILDIGQAEGLCFSSTNAGYLSNEKVDALSINQRLHAFDISNLISAATTLFIFEGNGNWDEAANWKNSRIPAANLQVGSEIIINPLAGGQCTLNLPYIITQGVQLKVNDGKQFIIKGNLTLQ